MVRAGPLVLVIFAAAACSGVSTADRRLPTTSSSGGSAGAPIDGGSGGSPVASGGSPAIDGATGGFPAASGGVPGATGGAGGAPAVDAAAIDGGGLVCVALSPTTDSGTCPVMPPGGVLCAPPQAPITDCGTRGACAYLSGPGIPERYCPVVCADARGNCPPPESVCTPIGACQSAADCHGDLPEGGCRACPLAPDGTGTVACAHWVCSEGKCGVGYCEELGPTCNGGRGCPQYFFPAFDRSCGADTDCATFEHFENCCSTRLIGVSARDGTHAAGLETQCQALLVPFDRMCGCAGMPVAEDGGMPQPGQAIVGACVAGTCKAVVRGRITCGATSCPEGESCCTAPDASGYCVYSCAASCPPYSGCTVRP